MKPTSIFGSSLITGDFWVWKTFWIGVDVYQQKTDYPDICLIANLPWAIVDHFYSSVDDFVRIVDHLYRFVIETNRNEELTDYSCQWKDIIFVMDEAHRYLWARNFKENKDIWDKFGILLTQCRKRNIKMWFCTQRCRLIDINLRRLADYIYLYDADKVFGIKRSWLNVFQAGWGVADLLGDDWTTWETIDDLLESRVYKGLCSHKTDILDSLMKIKYPKWNLWDEQRISQYVCWLSNNNYLLDYEDFRESLKTNRHLEYAVSLYNESWIPLLWFWSKLVDDYGKTLSLYSTSL